MNHKGSDDAQLAALGLRSELRRDFSTLSMLGLAFAVLNTWTAVSASLPVSLTSGGSISIVWGLFTAGLCNLCIAASLAEFLSAYPTAGGQYHWVAGKTRVFGFLLSWPKWTPILSWVNGWIAVAGWVALVATNALLSSQLMVGIVSLLHPAYEAQRWHQFLIYIALTLLSFLVNAFLNSLLPIIYRGAFAWSIGGFVVACIAMLACASPEYHSASFVFGEFINRTGSPKIDASAQLLQGGLGVTAFDAVAHMIEEIPDASVQGPKIMVLCVIIGTVTGAIFLIVLLFVSGDMEAVISSSAGPLLQIFLNATSNAAGAICLLMLPLICIVFALLSVMTTSSRMIFAFARDGGLPASPAFARVHPRLGQPLNALALSSVVVILFGFVFLASSSAFNAIMSASVVALDLSYGMPIAIRCLRGRDILPEGRWRLPAWLGWTVDLISLAYISLTTVLFLLPPNRPVTGTNMNYCVVAFAIVIVVSVFQWVVDGQKNFVGPRLNFETSHEQSENGNSRGVLAADGAPLPPGDEHAVSVSLPTWRDTLGWAHRDESVLCQFQTGYPRFYVPHLVRDLAQRLVRWAKQPISASAAVLLPSSTMAGSCELYLKKRGAVLGQEASVVSFSVRFDDGLIQAIDEDFHSTGPYDHVFVVLHPDSLSREAKAFWQHTGFGISSRFASFWLNNAPFLGDEKINMKKNNLSGSAELLPVVEARQAALSLGQRIAGLYSVSQDDVFLYHTGMSAIAHAALALRGDSDKACRVAVFGFPYVDTFKVLSRVHGFECVLYGHASTSELDGLEAELESGTRFDMLVAEFPGNPLLRSSDLSRLSALSRKHGFSIIIDDTIGTAVNVNVISCCDVICTSLTKMFSGACNVMGGSIVLSPYSRHQRSLRDGLSDTYEDTYFPLDVIVMNQNSAAFESRVLMASRNAKRLVQQLRCHRAVDRVYYPWGDATQHLYDLFRRPEGEYGYLVTIQFVEPAAAVAFFDALDVAKGPSLGTNFTLCCAYTLLAHASELEWAAKYGVTEHLVRISVGIEEQESLVALVDAALAATEPNLYSLWVSGQDTQGHGEIIPVQDPSTGQVFAECQSASPSDVETAIQAAHKTFTSGIWSRAPRQARASVLDRAADLLSDELPALIRLEVRQTGRAVREMKAQLPTLLRWFRYYAAVIRTEERPLLPTTGSLHNWLERVPLGVVVQLTPFNHPLLIAVKKLAPALAAGNCVIVKPSELAPLTCLRLGPLLKAAGLPDGVLAVLPGYGPVTGAALVGNPLVRKVDVTGGTVAGRAIGAVVGRNLARYTAELGGKAPLVVFDSACVDAAVNGIAFGAFVASGQTCVAATRIIAHVSLLPELEEKLRRKSESIARRMGSPSNPDSSMGSLISARQLDGVDALVREAISGPEPAARLVCGGRRMTGLSPLDGTDLSQGYFYPPTVLSSTTGNSITSTRLWREEAFGPAIVLVGFDSEAEAVELANDSEYGLGAAIWTRDLAQAFRVTGRIECGIVWVNTHHRNDPSSPWGGATNASGVGSENGLEAYHAYTTTKSIIINYAPVEESLVDDDWFKEGAENVRYG
ncbi:hypothetical protein CP533_3657 [Ophiocordyceps camponoti-saundersi (nom. inval.)]|nr:hypothetical protein CP533_3657 [Ophiocordyceps camponoti-saundersi (nom. inval.)]